MIYAHEKWQEGLCKPLLTYKSGIYFVKLGENFTLDCMYNECKKLQFQVHWCKEKGRQDCTVIPENTKDVIYSSREPAMNKTKSITVMNATKEASGRYECQATVPPSLSPFAIGHIVNIVVAEFAVNISEPTVQLSEGDSVNLTCAITFPANHLDKVFIAWMKDNISCELADPTKGNMSTLIFGEKGKDRSVLFLTKVTLKHTGFYTCCVFAKDLNTLSNGATAVIHVIQVMSSNGIILSTFGPILLCKFIFLVFLLVFISNLFRQQENTQKINLTCQCYAAVQRPREPTTWTELTEYRK
ncbi:uncharacterized protein LOC115480504 isoform X2 [Microcaecilia unicolor]|uniref:Uncharacterized protein LOC115480504 isoform X2 n=1 Tax=Microcaecilia unicolor TaxID=1415580 RepID=A0A6P7Z6V8_9AMPH|nr:uncharacterized protein LOC115480504 isoform X2 [Microcaecilia unicolor]